MVPSCSTRALCFGPWDGGMVTPALKAHFKSQGVQIIPRAEGAEQVAALLAMAGRERNQILVGNWGMPAVAPLEADLIVTATLRAPASGLNAFLASHEIHGKPVLPMTVAVAHLAATALKLHKGYHLTRVEGAKLFGGVPLAADVPTTIKVSRAGPANGSLSLTCTLLKQTDAGRLQP